MPNKCFSDGCENAARSTAAGALCQKHYQRQWRALQETEEIEQGRSTTATTPQLTSARDALAGALDAAMAEAVDAGNRSAADIEAIEQELALLEQRLDARLQSIEAAAGATVTIETATPQGLQSKQELAHYMLEGFATAVGAGCNVLGVGPAGSGKTTMAQQAAKLLGREFRQSGPIQSAFQLLGFINAEGKYIPSLFREAFESGHIMIFDELDNFSPKALKTFNACIENGTADFPDGMVKRGNGFAVIGLANTYGTGANSQYVGEQLCSSTLDRFATVTVPIDERLEALVCGVTHMGKAPSWNWKRTASAAGIQELCQKHYDKVLRWRAAAADLGIKLEISPRASKLGCSLIRNGFNGRTAFELSVIKGMSDDIKGKLAAAAGEK